MFSYFKLLENKFIFQFSNKNCELHLKMTELGKMIHFYKLRKMPLIVSIIFN